LPSSCCTSSQNDSVTPTQVWSSSASENSTTIFRRTRSKMRCTPLVLLPPKAPTCGSFTPAHAHTQTAPLPCSFVCCLSVSSLQLVSCVVSRCQHRWCKRSICIHQHHATAHHTFRFFESITSSPSLHEPQHHHVRPSPSPKTDLSTVCENPVCQVGSTSS
jgi:hypothetical protein